MDHIGKERGDICRTEITGMSKIMRATFETEVLCMGTIYFVPLSSMYSGKYEVCTRICYD
jgi:hypothetical protein